MRGIWLSDTKYVIQTCWCPQCQAEALEAEEPSIVGREAALRPESAVGANRGHDTASFKASQAAPDPANLTESHADSAALDA